MSLPKSEVFDKILKEVTHTTSPDGTSVKKPFQIYTARMTSQEVNQEEIFLALAKNGNVKLLPRIFPNVTKELMAKLPVDAFAKQHENGISVMHCAAIAGKLGDMPAKTLTPELLLLKDAQGRTPLSIAASRGHLKQIPITQELTERAQEVQEAIKFGLQSNPVANKEIQGAYNDWSKEFTRLAINGLAPKGPGVQLETESPALEI